jgi:hypothetical protein
MLRAVETQEALSKASASMDQLLTHTQNELRESQVSHHAYTTRSAHSTACMQAQVEQLLSEVSV